MRMGCGYGIGWVLAGLMWLAVGVGCGGGREVEGVESASAPAVLIERGALYVRLDVTAAALGLELEGAEGMNSAALVLRGERGLRIEVLAGQAAVRINGILMHTGLATISRTGAAYVSAHDLHWVWQPLVNHFDAAGAAQGPKEDSDETVGKAVTVFIDPGHGGRDPGAVGPHCGTREKDLALEVSLELGNLLEAVDLKVVFSRKDDTFVELRERSRLANASKADLFLSIHFNAATNPEASGIEVFVLQPPGERPHSKLPHFLADRVFLPGHAQAPESLGVAFRLQERLIRMTEERDRGVRRARFAVLRDLEMPGVLLELGFLTHEPTAERLSDAEYRRELATIIAEMVVEWSIGQRGEPD